MRWWEEQQGRFEVSWGLPQLKCSVLDISRNENLFHGWLVGRIRPLCAYTIDGCPSRSRSAVNGNDRLWYKIAECEYSLWIKGVPVCTTGDHITRYFKQQELDVGATKDLVAAIGSAWLKVNLHLSFFWNPTFTGVAGTFAHCRQGYSKCLYLFVLQA